MTKLLPDLSPMFSDAPPDNGKALSNKTNRERQGWAGSPLSRFESRWGYHKNPYSIRVSGAPEQFSEAKCHECVTEPSGTVKPARKHQPTRRSNALAAAAS